MVISMMIFKFDLTNLVLAFMVFTAASGTAIGPPQNAQVFISNVSLNCVFSSDVGVNIYSTDVPGEGGCTGACQQLEPNPLSAWVYNPPNTIDLTTCYLWTGSTCGEAGTETVTVQSDICHSLNISETVSMMCFTGVC